MLRSDAILRRMDVPVKCLSYAQVFPEPLPLNSLFQTLSPIP